MRPILAPKAAAAKLEAYLTWHRQRPGGASQPGGLDLLVLLEPLEDAGAGHGREGLYQLLAEHLAGGYSRHQPQPEEPCSSLATCVGHP